MERLSMNQQVTNMSGTSRQTPNNDSTWKQMWERKTCGSFGVCSTSGCMNYATDGAHVRVQGKIFRICFKNVPKCYFKLIFKLIFFFLLKKISCFFFWKMATKFFIRWVNPSPSYQLIPDEIQRFSNKVFYF